MAVLLAGQVGGTADDSIIQRNQVFHTGADPMERLNARPVFDGDVVAGARYVLVGDVLTMGGTLAELANFLQERGGQVAAVAVLAAVGRAGHVIPSRRVVGHIEERFGDAIREVFGVAPAALTADEANYLIGFRHADELRGRSLKAQQETHRRLRSKQDPGVA